MLENGDEIWLGLQNVSGIFKWYGNYASYNYSNWAPEEPSVDNEKQCFTLKKWNESTTFWYARKCKNRYGSICQRCRIFYYNLTIWFCLPCWK